MHYSGFCLWDPNLYKFCKMLCACKLNSTCTVLLIPSFQLGHCCACHSPVSCNLISLCFFTNEYFKKVDIWFCFTAVPDLKGPSFMIATTQHFPNVTWPNILVNVVSSNHTTCCLGFWFRFHCTCRTWWFLKRSCIWLLEGFADIINSDITAGQEIDASQKLGLAHCTCYMVM